MPANAGTEHGKWVVLKKYSHSTHYGWDDGSKFLNPERPYYTMTATVKWDGCVDIHRYYNGQAEGDKDAEPDYMHICGIAEFIATLEALPPPKDPAKEEPHDG